MWRRGLDLTLVKPMSEFRKICIHPQVQVACDGVATTSKVTEQLEALERFGTSPPNGFGHMKTAGSRKY